MNLLLTFFAPIALLVKRGDPVVRGQVLGEGGNNGFGRAPHIHAGAWRGTTPLQIRWDLTATVKD